MARRAAHKTVDVRQAIERAGASRAPLPPYSPGFNPTENTFSKLNNFLKKTAAGTKDDLWKAIGTASTHIALHPNASTTSLLPGMTAIERKGQERRGMPVVGATAEASQYDAYQSERGVIKARIENHLSINWSQFGIG